MMPPAQAPISNCITRATCVATAPGAGGWGAHPVPARLHFIGMDWRLLADDSEVRKAEPFPGSSHVYAIVCARVLVRRARGARIANAGAGGGN